MYFSDAIIEEVRSRNDIIEVIGGHVTLKHKGNTYQACCPFHHEKTPSFHVSKDKQMYHCFGCGVGGNVYTFIMEYENFSFPEAVNYLAERVGFKLPEHELSEQEKIIHNFRTRLYEMNKASAAYFHYLLKKVDRGKFAYKYLIDRGYTEETIDKFAVGYSDIYKDDLYKYLKNKGFADDELKQSGLVTIKETSVYDKFWNRVMVPILDINGKVIAFGGRVLGEGEPKYLNTQDTEVFDKSHTLFAINLARRSKLRGIIVCEGYMDVIALHQAGFDNSVASLGTAFTYGHANILKRYTEEVYLAYDTDMAGIKAGIKAYNILREMGITVRVIEMDPYKDPDEFIKNLGADKFKERVSKAVSGLMFELKVLNKEYNLNDPEEKIKFIRLVAQKISLIEDKVARQAYIDTISNEYFINRDILNEEVTKYGTMGINKESVVSARKSNLSNKEDAYKHQRILLTWMVNETKLFELLNGIISEDDFLQEEYIIVARNLFEQYKQTKSVNPASIVDLFDDITKQRFVAGILQTELPFETNELEKQRAINELVKRIKGISIDYQLSNVKDPLKMQDLIRKKSEIQKLNILI